MRSRIVKLVRIVVIGLIVVAGLVGARVFLKISHAGGIAGVQWNQIGPAPLNIDPNIDTNSGEVSDMAIDPRGSSDQIIFIATQGGGIWQSTDGGNTWRTTTDFLDSLSMGAVALDPANPSIVYAGTGSPVNNGFFKGIGIYKSTDDGGMWTLTPAAGVSFKGVAIRRMVMPNPNTLLVATGGEVDGKAIGLPRSTDGGNSFILPTINGSTVFAVNDLRLDTAATPTSASPQTVLAAIGNVGIFRSTDSGATWGANLWTTSNGSPLDTSLMNFTPGFILFAQSTTPDNQTIYASVQNVNANAANPKWGLFQSTDGGATWNQRAAAGNPSGNCGQCGYNQTMGVDPNDAATVYVGFVGFSKSTDSGSSFAAMTGVHADHHALVFSPHVPASGDTPFYAGQDGGIARSDGSSFTSINGPNPGPGQALATNLMTFIDIGRGSSHNNGYTYGGMWDCGTGEFRPAEGSRPADSPTTWHRAIGGDGLSVAVDPFNPQHAITMDNNCLAFTTTAGSSWTFAKAPCGADAVAFDQINSGGTDNTVYASINAAQNQVFRSTDGGASYAQFASPSTYPALIDVLTTVKIDPDTIWLGLRDSTVRVSTNATSGSPSFAAPGAQPPAAPNMRVTAIAIDPTNPQTVVVTYPGFGNRHVFMTTDGGSSWADLSAALPNLPVHSVVIDPNTSPHTIIIANDAGVLQTADVGKSWQVLGVGMPYVDTVSLALDWSVTPEVLRAGTWGRSVFELGAAQGPLLSINSPYNFGTLCPGDTPTELLQLFNVGSSNLTISSISPVAGSSADFSLSGPSFPVTILPGEELDYTVSFKPSIANEGKTEKATFQIDSNAVVNPDQQVSYTATVGAPSGSTVIASGGNFNSVCVGSSATLNLTIANSGTCDLLVTGITSNDGDFMPPSTLTYPLAVQAGNSITVPVEFAPQTFGTKNGIVTVASSNNPGGNMAVSVGGDAPAPIVAIAMNTNWGHVCLGSFEDQNLTISNSGKCPLTVTNITSSDSQFQTATVLSFPLVVAAGGSTAIDIRFQPSVGFGSFTDVITVATNDPNAPNTSVTSQATVPSGHITASGSAAFGNVCAGSNAQQTLTVANTGACNLHVTSATISCADFTIQGNPFPATLSPDSSMPLVVAFTPTSGGAKSCTLSINSDDPNTPTLTFNLTAATPPVNIDVPPDQNFPATVIQSVGACHSLNPFPVSNNGVCPLMIDAVVVGGRNAGDFALSALPSLPTPLASSQVLGAGNLDTVFGPTVVSRGRQGTVTVTYESDPITHATTQITRNLCGEGGETGARVLVTVGGVPLASVDKIQLVRINSNRKGIVDVVQNAALQTVTQAAPCASFQFHREWGGVTNPVLLTPGSYQVTVMVTIKGKKQNQTVSFSLDTCGFDQNVVVNF